MDNFNWLLKFSHWENFVACENNQTFKKVSNLTVFSLILHSVIDQEK